MDSTSWRREVQRFVTICGCASQGRCGDMWGHSENRVKVDATLVPLTHSAVTLIPFTPF